MTTAVLGYVNSINLPRVNWKAVCCLGFFISLFLLVFYVWQINALTRGFYIMNSYEKQIDEILEENKNLQVSFAESSFLGEAFIKIQALNFQKTTLVKYIHIPNSSVAISGIK